MDEGRAIRRSSVVGRQAWYNSQRCSISRRWKNWGWRLESAACCRIDSCSDESL